MIGIHTSPMDHLGLLCLKLGHVGSARTLRDLRGNKDGLVVFRRKCADRLEISAECTDLSHRIHAMGSTVFRKKTKTTTHMLRHTTRFHNNELYHKNVKVHS